MADLNEEQNENNINNNINVDNKNRLNPCRCPECYSIPLIMMYEEENKLKLKFKFQKIMSMMKNMNYCIRRVR